MRQLWYFPAKPSHPLVLSLSKDTRDSRFRQPCWAWGRRWHASFDKLKDDRVE